MLFIRRLFRASSSALPPFSRPMSTAIPRDVQAFLDDYPGQRDDPSLRANLEFYTGTRRCEPDGLLIDDLHQRWAGEYDTLEYKHGFIQWLFPIQEHGMNWESQPLQKHERAAMRSDAAVRARVLRSYELMLDFYGMRLVDRDTGLLDVSLPPRNHEARYRNLSRSAHNYLRISRILKHLGELGLDALPAGFLLHVLAEQSEHDALVAPALVSSMDRWWANCLRDERERVWIREQITRVRAGELTFTRTMYEQALQRRREGDGFEEAPADD